MMRAAVEGSVTRRKKNEGRHACRPSSCYAHRQSRLRCAPRGRGSGYSCPDFADLGFLKKNHQIATIRARINATYR